MLRILLPHPSSPPPVPTSAPVGAEARRSYRDGGMTGWEGAEEGLEERLVFSVGLRVAIIPLGPACVHVQHGSKEFPKVRQS